MKYSMNCKKYLSGAIAAFLIVGAGVAQAQQSHKGYGHPVTVHQVNNGHYKQKGYGQQQYKNKHHQQYKNKQHQNRSSLNKHYKNKYYYSPKHAGKQHVKPGLSSHYVFSYQWSK